jgi:hypothetical protein
MVNVSDERISEDIWICDSGASGHHSMSMNGIIITQDINEKVTIGNGNKMVSSKSGSLRHHVNEDNGSPLDIIIKEAKYLPDSCVNLFTANKEIKNRSDLSNEGEKKDQPQSLFDGIIKSLDGIILGIKMAQQNSCDAHVAQSKLV